MRRASELSKKSLVINSKSLRRWVRLGGFRTESEAVRAAVEKALAIRDMQDAIERLQQSRTFGRHLQ